MMNKKHAEEILKALSESLKSSEVVHAGALLFEDDCTLREHVIAALEGRTLLGMKTIGESRTGNG